MARGLYLVDRSRYETGVGHCARARYLQYHAGPHGYGWQRQGVGIPTTTGTLVHDPLATVLAEVQRTDTLPSDEFVYQAIHAAVRAYHGIVQSRGLTTLMEPQDLAGRVREQTLLLEGLVWTWVTAVLPTFHMEHRIVSVEVEDVTVLGCSCGLGDQMGTAAEHDTRECRGIGWMTRADIVTESRQSPGSYTYHEFKTCAEASMNWEAQWAHRVQLIAGVLGIEARLGIQVDAVMIHALIKGKFQATWVPGQGASGPKYQNSALVYGWRRAAIDGLLPEDWAPAYEYVDAEGKNRRLGKDYQRTPVDELPGHWWQTNGALSPSQYWTRWIAPTGVLAKSYRAIGPIYRQAWKLEQFVRQLIASEARWQQALWQLADADATGHGWATPEFQARLDVLVPQSRGDACQSYFGDTCPMLKLCDRYEGWERPETLGYIPRRPHHTSELFQAVERGLLPPDVGTAEETE